MSCLKVHIVIRVRLSRIIKVYNHNVIEEIIAVEIIFFFQAEDGIRDLVRSRGLGDVYKRQLFE